MKFRKLQQYSFLLLLAFISIAFLWIINDFLMPIFWALVFAIIFKPVQTKWLSITKDRKNTASALTLISIILIVFIPLFYLSSLVLQESVQIYQQISVTETTGTISVQIFGHLDNILGYLEPLGIDKTNMEERLGSFVGKSTAWLSGQVLAFGQSTFSIILQTFVMLYVLFFMLRDGAFIRKRLIEILPFGDKREEDLFTKFTSTTRAVIKGTFVIGFIQGAIGALLFSIAGINGALLWGVVMMILSVIPALGASIIWLPAGLLLLFTSNIWQGAVVLIGGVLIISLIDNILRPILVGKDTKMPDAVILISTLGGLSVLGITGFVIGPVVAGFFIATWYMFEEEYQQDLSLHG